MVVSLCPFEFHKNPTKSLTNEIVLCFCTFPNIRIAKKMWKPMDNCKFIIEDQLIFHTLPLPFCGKI